MPHFSKTQCFQVAQVKKKGRSHGETEANATGRMQGSGIDLDLNDTGIAQGKALRDQLANEKVDLIVCSKLKRAKQTAELVQEKHPNVPLIEVGELAEISWGVWEGELTPNLPGLLSSWEEGDYHAKSPEGESPLEVEKRAVPALYDIILNRPEVNIVFVVHGRLLRILLSSILFRNLNHMNEFTHHNTCINLIDVILESDPSQFTDNPLWDIYGNLKGKKVELDDNVHVNPGSVHPTKKLTPTIVIPKILHPRNLKFVPVLLDDRRHLSSLK